MLKQLIVMYLRAKPDDHYFAKYNHLSVSVEEWVEKLFTDQHPIERAFAWRTFKEFCLTQGHTGELVEQLGQLLYDWHYEGLSVARFKFPTFFEDKSLSLSEQGFL